VAVAEEEVPTAAAVAAFTLVAGVDIMAVGAGLAIVAVEALAEEVRDLSVVEVLTEAEAFAADHRRTTSEPTAVPTADSADRAA
jgi:hypothetical protein